MRSYGKIKPTQPIGYRQRETREDVEWDLRIDLNDTVTIDSIVKHVSSIPNCVYALVSGTEAPDENTTYGSKENHVHVALVVENPLKRAEALKAVRGSRKYTEEYAAPRNRKYTYAGWFIHHTKLLTKLEGQPRFAFEFGTLPMDPFTIESAEKIKRIQDRYGDELTAKLFKGYFDLLPSSQDKFLDEVLTLQEKLGDATDK